MLKYISFCCLSLLYVNISLFGGNPTLPETIQNIEKPKICFTGNKGQVYDQNYKPRLDILYGAMAGNMAVHIKNNGVSYQLYQVDKYKEVEDPKTKEKRQEVTQQTIYRVDLFWLNANRNITKSEDEALPGYNNYYLESCPNGALNVKSYTGISLNNLYPGINLHYYEKNGELKHDYIVAAHADYKQIQIKVEGAEISVNRDGSLYLKSPLGKIQEGAPIVYQNNKQLNAKWRVKNNILGFEIENYNPNLSLIIDPVTRIWGTYFGGSGFEPGGRSCSSDNFGNVYMAGDTEASTGTIIATSGAHQTIIGGASYDAFIVKFNAAGVRQWGTYYGGTGFYDSGHSCSTDVSGNVYLAGSTDSFTGTTIASNGSHQTAHGGGSSDAFLVKFDNAGVRQWGTYYGGTGLEVGYSCSTDASGNVYLCGHSSSNTGTIIATIGSHQQTNGGGGFNDAFLVKFNAAGVRQWGTYYGGSGFDNAFSCSADLFGNIYLSGRAEFSSGTEIATVGSHQSWASGNGDAFLAKFNSAGLRQWGTYYGGTGTDIAYSCCSDLVGNVFIAGCTSSPTGGNLIASVGSHQFTNGGNIGTFDAFCAKFDNTGVRQWGSYYGGTGNEYGYGCSTDASGNFYLAGITASNAGTVIATAGSHQLNFAGGTWYDAFLTQFNNNGIRQWGTFYGGSGNDEAKSCCTDGLGNIYMAGVSSSNAGTVISTGWSHQSIQGGQTDAMLVKFKDCISLSPSASVNSTVCANSTLSFSASITGTITPTFNWIGPSSFVSNVQNPVILLASSANIGIYTLSINNNNCIETVTTAVSMVFNLPIVSVNSGTICLGESFTISPSGANTYTVSGGNFLVSPNTTTSYSVSGTSLEGCISAVVVTTITVDQCVGNAENLKINKPQIRIYPNPSQGIINMESDAEAGALVFDPQGRLVCSFMITKGSSQVSMEQLESGSYFVEFTHTQGRMVFRLIKL